MAGFTPQRPPVKPPVHNNLQHSLPFAKRPALLPTITGKQITQMQPARAGLTPAQRAYQQAQQRFSPKASPATYKNTHGPNRTPNVSTASAMANAMIRQLPLKGIADQNKAGARFLQLASLFVGGPRGIETGAVQPHILSREAAMNLTPREAAKYVFHGGSKPGIQKAWREGNLTPSVPRDAGLMPHTRRDAGVWLARNPREAADYASPQWHGHHEDGLVLAIPRKSVDPRNTKFPTSQRMRGFGGDLSGTNLLIRGLVPLIQKKASIGERSFRPGGPTINQMTAHIGRGSAPAHKFNPFPSNPFRP